MGALACGRRELVAGQGPERVVPAEPGSRVEGRPPPWETRSLAPPARDTRRGDQGRTQGGIIGKVTKVNEDGTAEVEIADGVKVKILRHTIAQVMNKTDPAAA